MRTETIEIKIYKFEELSDSAKDKAVERVASGGLDYEWWDGIYDQAKEMGIDITGFDLYRQDLTFKLLRGKDLQGYAKAFLDKTKDWSDTKGKSNLTEHKADCENYLNDIKAIVALTQEIEDDTERYEEELLLDKKIDALEDDFKRDICSYWRLVLQTEEDYLTSREVIEENIVSNDYEFTEDGEYV
jgi:hypothetical protein